MLRGRIMLMLSMLLGAGAVAQADEVVIAQVAPLSGVLATTGERMVLGAKLHFDAVNADGGINGRMIRHVVRDDGYRVDDTIAQTRDLLENVKPLALIGFAGTANITALLASGLLEKHRTFMVGPYTGGESLRTPYNPWLFHVRASYEDEAEHIVQQLTQLGSRRIAVLYQDDGFGRSGLVGVEAALQRRGLEPVARASYDRVSADVAQAAATMVEARPDVIIMISINRATAAFARQYRSAGGMAQLFNISVVDPQELVQLAGLESVHGLGISQVTPYPYRGLLPVVRDYQAALARFAPPGTTPSYTSFETYIAARVLTAALRRLGPDAVPKDVEAALEGLGRIDIGGHELEYGPKRRDGSKFVELTVIGGNGQLMR